MTKQAMKDQVIINMLRERKEDRAFLKLYAYRQVVRKFILANHGTKQDADDIFQEGLIILCRKVERPDFVLTSSLNTFLFGICRRLWLDQLGRRKVKTSVIDTDDYWQQDEDIRSEGSYRIAEQALSKITSACKEILRMFYHGGMSMVEIAGKLKITSENAAKTQKYKCLEKARNEYLYLDSLQNNQES